MSIFSSGKKWKRAAEQALQNARRVQDYQGEVEFRRQMLSNIRQERIARAQLEVDSYNTTARNTTDQGFIANIDSSLAGETYFAYASSDRAKQIQDYQQQAQRYYKKYQKQQKTRATAYAVSGIVVGALAGGALGAAGMLGSLGATQGAMMLGQMGQGIGQIASGTGQTQQGIQSILGSFSYGIKQNVANKANDELIGAIRNFNNTNKTYSGYNRYEAISLDNRGKMMFNNAEQFLLPQPNGTTVKAVRGCYNA